jgi:hypothetical protein
MAQVTKTNPDQDAINAYLAGNSVRRVKTSKPHNDLKHGKITRGFHLNALRDNTEIK